MIAAESALVPVAEMPLPAVVEAEALKTEALERAALIGVIKNPKHQSDAVVVLRDVKSLLSSIEKARVKAKEKPLDLCRAIDKAAKDFSEALKAEEVRISTAIGNYQQEELEKAREVERQRQAELRRIEEERIAELARIEAEKQRAEAARQAELKRIADEQAAREAEARRVQEEAARKAREAAEAAAKLAAEATNKAQREAAEKARKEAEEQAATAAFIKSKEDALLAEQARKSAEEFARIEAERKASEEAAAVERQRQQELAAQKMEAVGPQVGTVLAKGQSVKEEFDFEVTDIWTLAKMHPGLVKIEVSRSEVMACIKAGSRNGDIKGLRIFPVVKTQVRGAGKTIDV